jgi:hypothetical protein
MTSDDRSESHRDHSGTTSLSSIAEVVDQHGVDPFLDAPTEFHDVLSSPLRKRALTELVQAEDTLSARELAERLAEADREDTVDDGELLVRLHHIHLPKLRSHGLVTMSEDSGLIDLDIGSD